MYDECKSVGIMNNNPLLYNRAYEVEFSYGTTEVLTANIIYENLLAQFDEKVHRQVLLDKIIDHIQDVNAIGKEDAFTKTPNGMTQRKIIHQVGSYAFN